jgi:FkbM family methyltransferase
MSVLRNAFLKRQPERPRELIFDIGLNNGEDTEFYLAKGFSVIAVEANPTLAKAAEKRFSRPLNRGHLTILNEGIWSSDGELQFFENLDNDHWSSFEKEYGTRNGTRYREHNIVCHKVQYLFERFGTPHFMKIDVEGADKHILDDMKSLPNRPNFISVEEYGVEALIALHDLGYDRFTIVPQRDKSWCKPPRPPKEGRFAKRAFDSRDSGLFGRELPFGWMPFAEARERYCTKVRNEDRKYVGPEHEWYDIHATFARLVV